MVRVTLLIFALVITIVLMEIMIIKVSWEKRKIKWLFCLFCVFTTLCTWLYILNCSYVISDYIRQILHNYWPDHYIALCFPWIELCAAPMTIKYSATAWKKNLMSRLDRKFNTFETITNTGDLWCVHNSFDNKNNLSKGDIHLISIVQTSQSYSNDLNTDLNVYYF